MAKKKKCPECPAGEKWAVPYADFLSLLLALFIALYAISAANTEKLKALKTEFIKIFDYTPKPDQAQPVIPLAPTSEASNMEIQEQQSKDTTTSQGQANQSVAELAQQGGVLEQVEEGVVLKLPTDLLFPINEDKLEDKDSELFFKRIAEIVHRLPKNIKIDVRGFAQTPKGETSKFQNDYELASARAMFVMNALIQNGISPQQIFFSSQGQYGKTIHSNDPEERIQKNNKVEIYFFVNEKQGQEAKKLLRELKDK